MQRRVVITGVGPVTPAGTGTEELWMAIISNRSSAGRITRFDASRYKTRIACEIRDLPTAPNAPNSSILDRKLGRLGTLGRSLRYARVAAGLAVSDARLQFDQEDRERVGVILGGDIGDPAITHQLATTPSYLLLGAVRSAAGVIAFEHDLRGPCHGVSAACASGNVCLDQGINEILRGRADVMLVGSTDALIVAPRPFADFDALGVMSRHNHDPVAACRPFDRDRDGFVLSEGAGVLVLETLEHAQARGATPYAEILGVGRYTLADSTFARVSAEGYVGAMQMALRDAGRVARELGDRVYINAHGTATQNNDLEESKAIRDVFGQRADQLLVSSIKPIIGHLQTASSTIELIVCALALRRAIIPATVNLEHPGPGCDLNYVAGAPVQFRPRFVVKNASGFCGMYSTVILRPLD